MKKLKYDFLQTKLARLGLQIFTVEDLIKLFKVKRKSAQAFLSYNVQQKRLKRLKQGYYTLANSQPHEFMIANTIYAPSYVSLFSALSFHHLIPESIYAVTSVTSRKTAEFAVQGLQYQYRSIKQAAYTGYAVQQLTQSEGQRVRLAYPEKAVADLFYLQSLPQANQGAGQNKDWLDRLAREQLDQSELENYLHLLGGKQLVSIWQQYA